MMPQATTCSRRSRERAAPALGTTVDSRVCAIERTAMSLLRSFAPTPSANSLRQVRLVDAQEAHLDQADGDQDQEEDQRRRRRVAEVEAVEGVLVDEPVDH